MSQNWQNLSDTDRKAYEEYVLAQNDQDRGDAIKKLIPGSELYYYLYFIDRMKNVGSKLTSEDDIVMSQFTQRFSNTSSYHTIQSRLYFLRYDQCENPNDKKNLLADLQYGGKVYGLNFNHEKPEDMRRQDDSLSSQSEDEGASDIPSTNLLNIPSNDLIGLNFGVPIQQSSKPKRQHRFEYDNFFSKDKLRSRYSPTNDENFDQSKLRDVALGQEHKIDFTKYHPKAFYGWVCSNSLTQIAEIQNPTFYDALQKSLEMLKETERYFVLNSNFLNNMTLLQLDKLASLVPWVKDDKFFVGSYFQKHFHEELSSENQEFWPNEVKLQNLKTLYQYAEKNGLPQSLKSSLVLEILQLGVKMNIYDKEYFKKYLDQPLVSQTSQFNVKKRHANIDIADNHWNNYIGNVQSASNKSGGWHESQNSMTKQFLEHFCHQDDSLKEFEDNFEVSFLKEIEDRIAIFKADDLTNLKIDVKKYQQISSEVIVRFLDSNQELFKVEEDVKLELELKNVQTLYVKIFEFNTETYYKKTLQPFNTGVNLDGLIASIEKQFEYKYPPNKKFIETFVFSELTEKVGLFIVEFIGNGMSSRAVIKKGSLSMIHKPTIAGHLAYVLDENKKICSGPKTGIYFDGQYFESNQEKGGKIFIPYGQSNLVQKAILLNNGFAQLSDFERQTERYTFKAIILLNKESILIGNKAQILIKPSLYVNDRPASVQVLKKTTVTLTTVDYLDSNTVTKTFENLTFKDNEDLIIDFQVPPYLEAINVDVTTQLFKISNQREETFSASSVFKVTQSYRDYIMSSLYLRKEQGEYNLYLLGRNGEPKPNVNIIVEASHKQNPQSGQSQTLNTDKNGRVQLGHLKDILAINCNVNLFKIEKRWMLYREEEYLSYPQQLDLVELQEIEFPVLFKTKKRKNISLIKIKDSSIVLEDLYDRIKFEQQENKYYNKILINGLQEGTYVLHLKDVKRKISIIIHRGEYWENNSFILKRDSLFENKAAQKLLKIQNISVTPTENNRSDVTIKLEDYTNMTRVHLVANQFEDLASQSSYLHFAKELLNSANQTIFPFAQWKNFFMSNRELSDEFRYVFDRRYAERYQGNTLERPRLVLKRTLIGETQVDQESLRQGTSYEQHRSQDIQILSQNVAPRAMMQQMAQPRNRQMNNFQPQMKMARKSALALGSGSVEEFNQLTLMTLVENDHGPFKMIDDLQNFLKNGPVQEFNLKPDQNGEIKISLNLSSHTQLQVLAVDHKSVAFKQVDLPVNAIQKRDLSLNKPLDTEKGYTESRKTYNVLKGEKHQIEDITSTDIQIIDDLEKVKNVLDEVLKSAPSMEREIYNTLSEIFIQWNKTSTDEKNKHFSKHFCHELNLFIYFRDQPYFEEVVKPFLKHKMEKTFVDNYLLGYYEKCLEVFGMGTFEKINTLEKCLLVDILVKSGRVPDALRIRNYLTAMRDNTEYRDTNKENSIFDKVLNLNMLKDGDLLGAGAALLDQFADFGDIVGSSNQAQQSLFGAANNFNANSAFESLSNNNNNNIFNNFAMMQQVPYEQPLMGGMGAGGFGMPQAYAMPAPQMMQMQQQQPVQQRAMMLNSIQPSSYTSNATFGGASHDLFGDFSNSNKNIDMDIMQTYNEAKKNTRLQFEEVQKTNEYMETHYFKQKMYATSENNVGNNSFWVDYSTYLIERAENKDLQFLTSQFLRNVNNNISCLMTLALLDLPFNAEQHQYKTNEGRGLEVTASSNYILFKKEVREAQTDITNDILVIHRYQNPLNQTESSQTLPEEFLTNRAYQCEVIMTNVSPQKKEFSMLYQIPQGSLPLQKDKYMKSIPQTLTPYTTIRLTFHFYFPQAGSFVHFPSNISEDQKVIARAVANKLVVVDKFSTKKKETFRDIIQNGNKDDIIEFLRTANLFSGERGFNLQDMMWMLKDYEFFIRVTQTLRERLIFFDQVWKYGIYHREEQAIIELLSRGNGIQVKETLGEYFQSKLLSVNLVQKEIKHLDYYPIINSRAHQVGDTQNWTLNVNLRNTYNRLLSVLIQKPSLSISDKMQLVYYFQLQDRINEAIKLFQSIDINETVDETLRIQHDYLKAYFDFFTGQSESFITARSIVRKYEDYPVISWRMAFLEILDQLNEYDGEIEEYNEIDEDNMTEEQKKQKYKQSIRKEPRLEVDISTEKRQIVLEVANIKAVSIKFYIIDAEILFSRTPFLKENTEEFSYVKPCHVIERDLNNVDLNSSIDTITYLQQPQRFELDIPENLQNHNMVIEISGEGKQIFKTYYQTQIKVNILEAYGELKVTDCNGVPLSKVYVKVFYQKNGQPASIAAFYRDGYTDIRGKFEYAQSSGNKLKEVAKFAILVMSDTLGSVIKECNPPKMNAVSKDVEILVDGGSQQSMMKQERVLKNINWHKANYKK